MNRFFTRLRADNGSMMTTLVFILISTFVAAGVMAFYLMRSTNDYATGKQAQVKSAISQLSSKLLGEVNADFPEEWQYLSAEDLKAATAPMGEAPELQANAHLGYFALNPDTGVIVAEVVGQSTTPGAVRVIAEVKFTPSGAGVFRGTDAAGRPTWIYSDDNLDGLALWEMAPNAVQYINSGGDYVAEAPAQAPIVALQSTAGGARALIGSVYCRYGGTAEYEWAAAENSPEMGDWSGWDDQQYVDFEMNEGDRVEFQARSRCVSNVGVSEPSPTSNIATYSKPFTTVFAGPQVTITPEGVVSWGEVVCGPTSTDQYRYQYRLNEGAWQPWSDWGAAATFTQSLAQGSLLEAQVQGRCQNEYTTGPASSTGYGSAIAPLTTQPAAPAVALSGAVTATVTPSACPSGTSAQVRSQYKLDAGAYTSFSGWSTQLQRSVAANEGGTVAFRAEQRCISPYANGPGSATSAEATRNVPVTSVAPQPTVVLNSSGTQYSWAAVTCPVGTSPVYRWSHSANGGATVQVAPSLVPYPGATAVTINEGGTLTVWIAAACRGFNGSTGPESPLRSYAFTKDITTAPSRPGIAIGSSGTASWSSSGCPAGTSLQYAWSRAVNYGAWSGWSAWGTTAAYSSGINQGNAVAFGVQARCVNGATGETGPSSGSQTAGWYIRPVSAPAAPAVRYTGQYAIGVSWNAVSCAAGTTPYYRARAYRPSNGVFDHYYYTTGLSQGMHYMPAYGGYIYWQVSALCDGAYADSGYSSATQIRVP